MASSVIKKKENIYYEQGDTIALHFGFGYITNSGKTLNLFFPVGKIRPLGTSYSGTVSISSSSFTLSMRRGDLSGGYIPSSSYNAKSELSSAGWWGGYIQLVFVKSNNGNWGVTSQIPVVGNVEGTIRIG